MEINIRDINILQLIRNYGNGGVYGHIMKKDKHVMLIWTCWDPDAYEYREIEIMQKIRDLKIFIDKHSNFKCIYQIQPQTFRTMIMDIKIMLIEEVE